MGQTYKVNKNNTKIINEGDTTKVQLHDTIIVTITPDQIVLSQGEWATNTTKNKMNQVSNQFNLGYKVHQKNGEWFVVYGGKVFPYAESKFIIDRRKHVN